MTVFIIDFSEFRYFFQWYYYAWTNIVNGFGTAGGHKQFTIIKSLAVCAQKQEVNETFGF